MRSIACIEPASSLAAARRECDWPEGRPERRNADITWPTWSYMLRTAADTLFDQGRVLLRAGTTGRLFYSYCATISFELRRLEVIAQSFGIVRIAVPVLASD